MVHCFIEATPTALPMDLGRLGGPLGSPDPHPWRGYVEQDWRECVEEDCSEAFDDVGFHAWCVDQA